MGTLEAGSVLAIEQRLTTVQVEVSGLRAEHRMAMGVLRWAAGSMIVLALALLGHIGASLTLSARLSETASQQARTLERHEMAISATERGLRNLELDWRGAPRRAPTSQSQGSTP